MSVGNRRGLFEVDHENEGEGNEGGEVGDHDEDVEIVEVFVRDGESIDEEAPYLVGDESPEVQGAHDQGVHSAFYVLGTQTAGQHQEGDGVDLCEGLDDEGVSDAEHSVRDAQGLVASGHQQDLGQSRYRCQDGRHCE